MREKLRFFGGLIDWIGFPTASINVQHSTRFEGETAYTFGKLVKLASDTFIAYSDKPLRVSIKFGFTMSLLAFVFGCYILLHALIYSTVLSGWTSLFVSMYFLGGIIIAILGVIGIYLGKTFDETKKRPLYIIRRRT